MKHASEQDRRDWHQALNDYNAGVERARAEYAAHPTATKSYPCSLCTGWAYRAGVICIPCRKEGRSLT